MVQTDRKRIERHSWRVEVAQDTEGWSCCSGCVDTPEIIRKWDNLPGEVWLVTGGEGASECWREGGGPEVSSGHSREASRRLNSSCVGGK